MRGFALLALLASTPASADVVNLLGDSTWSKAERQTHDVPLDVRGWAVEARFALDANARVDIEIVDDRLTARFTRAGTNAVLDGGLFEIPELPTGMHTYRIEGSTGRRLLLVDGQVVADRDQILPTMAMATPTHVAIAGTGTGVHWQSLTVDTAPTGLATSSVPFQPAIVFSGPFASWFFRYANRTNQIAPMLAQLQLPEAARACVAFDIVASASSPRPKHYRPGELAKLPKNMPPEPPQPQIDFDLIETPPIEARRKPMMRRRRAAADVRAQVELFNAVKAKDPKPFYDRAVETVINEAGFTVDSLTFLQAVLPDLAKHPDGCR